MSGSRRRLVLLEHISLDGFLAGPNGEMEWIRVDDEIWEYVDPIAQRAGAAVFGRVTYQMMEPYWPTAGDSPDASRHDVDHSRWLNSASKLAFSNTLGSAPWGESASATLVTGDPAEAVQRLKSEPGADMLLIGSASLARTLIREGLIDEYRINVNPVMLGGGARLFPDAPTQGLEPVASRTFGSGVVGLRYVAAR